MKAICSKPCLVVIIWCADVPTHLRHWGWVTSTHRGQNKVGSQWPLLLILFRSCSVFMSKTCPQVDIKATLCTLNCTGILSTARSWCFAVWGRVFLFSSCNDLILYTLISHVNPPLWVTTHRGPNVVRRWHRPLQKLFCCNPNLGRAGFLHNCSFSFVL